MSHRSRWTDEEKDFLRENYQSMTYAEIGDRLGRTEGAVKRMRGEMDLERKKRELSPGESSAYRRFKSYEFDSKHEFEISFGYWKFLTKQVCYYCGKPPSQVYDVDGLKGSYTYNGIDRLDNERGYTRDNCVACCKECNRAKLEMDAEEYIEHCRRVVRHSL
jgi:hypothetical protein